MMNQYTATITIQAQPMTHEEAISKGFIPQASPEAVDHKEDGYALIFTDGHRSWLAKEDFAKVFRPSGTPLERMRIEAEQLKEKTDHLLAFTDSDKFSTLSDKMCELLTRQLGAMAKYHAYLTRRIRLMDKKNKFTT